MTPIVVSFYTLGTPYEQEARAMERTAHAFGLETDVRGVPTVGDWTRNCALKPTFIRSMMREHPGRPVVWLDADARVRQYPSLFDDLDCDFACHHRRGQELLSGTLFFGATDNARALVADWDCACHAAPFEWDQRCLQSAVARAPSLNIRELPASYVRIFDGDDMGSEIVIEHLQASRTLRYKV